MGIRKGCLVGVGVVVREVFLVVDVAPELGVPGLGLAEVAALADDGVVDDACFVQ